MGLGGGMRGSAGITTARASAPTKGAAAAAGCSAPTMTSPSISAPSRRTVLDRIRVIMHLR